MRTILLVVVGLIAAISVPLMSSSPASADNIIGPSGRRCVAVAGSPGDAAVVNVTPVLARGAGNGVVVSSDVATAPVAANVNFGVGSVDPNLVIVPIGDDGKVCYVNSRHTSVHLVADHLGTIANAAYAPAKASGAPTRLIDTRVAGGLIGPSGRRCVVVAGSPGDAAVVNVTPVLARGAGNGVVVSSDVATAPVAANVNFGVGSVDPNLVIVPIGDDGKVCYVNSRHTSVHLVADHLGTIANAAYTPATASGAPTRLIDTRVAGGLIGPSGRRCVAVAGSPGDAAVVNVTPVLARGAGNGVVVSSDVATAPVAANVNFGVGSVDPNLVIVPIGDDGKVCYVNSRHTSVHLVADHLGTIANAAYTPAKASGAPTRLIDTRPSRVGGVVLVGAGDIAGDGSGDTATAQLIKSIDPAAVFTLGDNVYPTGSASEFRNYYDPTWGQFKAITYPTIGNHDVMTQGGAPYRAYFGVSNYYSYDLGGWHIVVLDSNAPSDPKQLAWLRADLAANTSNCQIAMWHHPAYSSGAKHGNNPNVEVLWKLLVADHAELVLNGHEHQYERFAPKSGLTEIVVGTGGRSNYSFSSPEPGSLVRSSGTYGVLQLTLYAGSADFEFVPVQGKTFTDSGTIVCA